MALGSWLRDRPRLLERAYQATIKIFETVEPVIKRVGYGRVGRLITPAEELSKKVVFDCRMCGQCILHSTGMTCPMTCPKNLRNGPCGGVHTNGHYEVKPEMKCIWVEAFERSQEMATYGEEIIRLQPPVNRQLQDTSAWINMLTGLDKLVPAGWVNTADISVISTPNP